MGILKDLKIQVTNTPMANANTVAEHAIAFMIALSKKMLVFDRELRKGNYKIRNTLHGIDLEEKILGVIGLGRIGKLVASKAKNGFNMKIIGYDPYIKEDNLITNIELTSQWDYIFKKADFLSIHVPLNDKTRGIIGKKEFEMMKKTAFLINVARGGIVKEDELIDAIKEDKIAGAALDVYEKEPPLNDNPLLDLGNVILSPHNAALTKESAERMSLHAAISITEVLSGKKPS